ncbi:TetR family transcriptional regulator (plasmid) [Brachybacterium halotolerans subsp. kimchii]|uniref:TetR/AcrR family transcriptional regulator n=1 Tax=Brachybacterium halotolerans TaxID=2795215 RepID=UPI001E47DF24|nr:TetR family transcriptional regulator [Brachybacterium halotolerans]UEJ84635.1 TetR family transcriptional regulator [Brachybacterium halotolerans subsp. kimchii]
MAKNLGDVSRQAVRREIGEVAESMLIERGYEGATAEAITEAVGISKRTFFRYFSTKDEALLVRYEAFGKELAERLRETASDDPWEALGGMFQLAVEQHAVPERRARILTLQAIIEEHSSLAGAYLKRLDTIQEQLADILLERMPDSSTTTARSLVGAAFACFRAAVAEDATDAARNLDTALPAAMEALARQVAPKTA